LLGELKLWRRLVARLSQKLEQPRGLYGRRGRVLGYVLAPRDAYQDVAVSGVRPFACGEGPRDGWTIRIAKHLEIDCHCRCSIHSRKRKARPLRAPPGWFLRLFGVEGPATPFWRMGEADHEKLFKDFKRRAALFFEGSVRVDRSAHSRAAALHRVR